MKNLRKLLIANVLSSTRSACAQADTKYLNVCVSAGNEIIEPMKFSKRLQATQCYRVKSKNSGALPSTTSAWDMTSGGSAQHVLLLSPNEKMQSINTQ